MQTQQTTSEATALVGVRPEVIAEVEHAFGNLFHRLHYSARKLASSGVEEASAFDEAIAELEDFLRLLLDYTSPLAVEPRGIAATAVIGSLRSALVGRAEQLPPAMAECQTSVDPGRLSDAFQLMGYCLGESRERQLEVDADDEAEGGPWLAISAAEPRRDVIAGGRRLLAWAVAQKLVEAQGGELDGRAEASGLRWTLRLPLTRESG